MTNQDMVARAVADALEEQPGWYKHKTSILLVLVSLSWIVGAALPLVAHWPEEVTAVIGGIGSLAALIYSNLTYGEITPSMPERVAAHAPEEGASDAG